MRKPVIENIEIIEPPIGELTKQQGSLKKTCLTGCGCVIFLIIGLLVSIRLFVGSGPKTIKKLPENFPINIPIYEKDSIEQMVFISGKYKNRSIEIAAFFPKIILSPLLLPPGNDRPTSSEGFVAANKKLWHLLATPVSDTRDTIQIEWRAVDAEPGFIISYYRKELDKAGYSLSDVHQEGNNLNFTFENGENINGSLFTESDEQDHPGTDYALLTVSIPSWYRNPPSK